MSLLQHLDRWLGTGTPPPGPVGPGSPPAASAGTDTATVSCLQALPVMAALVDVQGQCLDVSPRLAAWLGFEPAALRGQPVETMFGEPQAGLMRAQLEAALSGQERRWRCSHGRLSDAERWLQIELIPQRDAQGEVDG